MTTEKHSIEYLATASLRPSPTNPRKHFDEEALAELAKSISVHGVLQNLLVRPLEGGLYEVVSGERRFRAVRHVGLSELPCAIREMTDEEVLELQIIENLQREDISPVEEARGYASLLELVDESGVSRYSPDSLAERIGKSKDYILRRVKIGNAPKRLLDAVAQGQVAIRTAELVGRIPDAANRRDATSRILKPELQSHPLTAEQAQAMIQSEFLVSLKGAFFDPDDAELTEAGACALCPFRSGNDPSLEGLLQKSGPGGRRGVDANLCTNPSCFREKEACAWSAATDELPKDVDGVLSPEEASKLFAPGQKTVLSGSEWVDVKAKPEYEDVGHFDEGKLNTWKANVDDALKSPVKLLRHRKDGRLLSTSETTELLAEGNPDPNVYDFWEGSLGDAMSVPVMLARNPHTGRVFRVVSRERAIEAVNTAAKAGGSVSPFEHRPAAGEDTERFRQDKQRKADEKKAQSARSAEALKALAAKLPENMASVPLRWAQLKLTLRYVGKDVCSMFAASYLGLSDVPGDHEGLIKAIMEFVQANVEENRDMGNPDAEMIGLWLTLVLAARDLVWEGVKGDGFGLLATIVDLDFDGLDS